MLTNPDFYLMCLAVACVALTVTRSSLFRGFRNWVRPRSKFFGKLTGCPYCFAHWMSFVGMWWFPGSSMGYLIGAFAMTAVASMIAGVISKLLLDSVLESEIQNLLEAMEDAQK